MDEYVLSYDTVKGRKHIGTYNSFEEAEQVCNRMLGTQSLEIGEPDNSQPVFIFKGVTESLGTYIMVMKKSSNG